MISLVLSLIGKRIIDFYLILYVCFYGPGFSLSQLFVCFYWCVPPVWSVAVLAALSLSILCAQFSYTSSSLLNWELRYLEKFGLSNGENHLRPKSLPNTAFILDHLLFWRVHLGSSCLSVSICVSSEKIAEIWVQNMTTVNIPNRSDSKPRRMRNMSVAAGVKLEQAAARIVRDSQR